MSLAGRSNGHQLPYVYTLSQRPSHNNAAIARQRQSSLSCSATQPVVVRRGLARRVSSSLSKPSARRIQICPTSSTTRRICHHRYRRQGLRPAARLSMAHGPRLSYRGSASALLNPYSSDGRVGLWHGSSSGVDPPRASSSQIRLDSTLQLLPQKSNDAITSSPFSSSYAKSICE